MRWEIGNKDVSLEWEDDTLEQTLEKTHHYYYIVVAQANKEMAWASPVFVTLDK